MDSLQTKEDLLAAAAHWIEGDPDPQTRAELEELVASEDEAALRDRLGSRLHFGTAGLRGAVGAGPNRMNRAVVIEATRGLAEHLLATSATGPVVVGYDARLSSRRFMEDTVGVLAAAGFRVRYFDEPAPTPLAAYAARKLDAAAAVVVTASHNPPQDNGYKVYASNGVQIVPPDDELIAAEISSVGHAALVPRVRWSAVVDSDLCKPFEAEVVFDYYQRALTRPRPDRQHASLRIVYTPMHGVGGIYTKALLEQAGHEVFEVATQFQPDGTFPTVDFPNPEEPGALDAAFATAAAVGDVDLIMANDPDADRLSVSVMRDGEWESLTGNQVGVLLAAWALDGSHSSPLVASSLVSSPMLRDLAAARGAAYAATLTGFKWIWNAALDLAEDGHEFVMGYEEALGYSVGPGVRDKDGMSAALVFADMAADAKARGSSVLGELAGLYAEVGVWSSAQHSVRLDGPGGMERIPPALDRLAAAPPGSVGEYEVVGVVDYRHGGESRPRYLEETALIQLDLAGGGRCLVRPSGTEPKLKIYVDLPAAAPDGADTAALLELEATNRRTAETVASRVADVLDLD